MCGKRNLGYREAHELINAAKHSKFQKQKKIPKRAYYCDVCRAWHLTSQAFYEETV